MRRCQCAIFLVNLNDKNSFDIVKYLYDEYKNSSKATEQYRGNCILLANLSNEDATRRLSNKNEMDSSRPSPETTKPIVQDFCQNNNIEFKEVNITANPKQAKEVVEKYFLVFCNENYQNLILEKKDLEPDSESSCNLI